MPHWAKKGKAELIISTSDLEKLQAVARLMGIFQTYSTMIDGQCYVTMSYLKVMLVKVNEHIKCTTDNSQMIKVVKQVMRENLSIRYQSEEQKIRIDITSMLDVRLKKMRYNSHKSHRDTLQTEAQWGEIISLQ